MKHIKKYLPLYLMLSALAIEIIGIIFSINASIIIASVVILFCLAVLSTGSGEEWIIKMFILLAPCKCGSDQLRMKFYLETDQKIKDIGDE